MLFPAGIALSAFRDRATRGDGMERYPKTIHLRDGTEVTLKPMTPNDLEVLVSFFKAIPERDRQFLRSDVTEREIVERRYVKQDLEKAIPLLAWVGSDLIGIGTLFVPWFGWLRTVGNVRVVVSRDYQHKGLGTRLIRQLFYHGLELKLHKLLAQIMVNQEGAVAALENLGFRPEATLRKHVVDLKGRRHDLLIMTLNLEELWHLMEDHLTETDIQRM
jgi:RimJ/RimL family protein N-acetyltransferase